MPTVATQAGAIDYVASEAVKHLGYEPGAVWHRCPVLTSNGNEHWASVALAIFDDPFRRGVPEHCCIGLETRNGDVEPAFRLLADSGAWAQIVVRNQDWIWRPEPAAEPQGPQPLSQLPAMLDRERPRLLPPAIMHEKRRGQGYLFDRIFPITHRKLVRIFEEAVRAGWAELTEKHRCQPAALEELCAAALRILGMQVFNHRDVLGGVPDSVISGPRRPATNYQELRARIGNLPAHLKGLRAYLGGRTGKLGLDAENAVFQALSKNNEYDFACLTPEMLGPFYQAALMRDPATGDVDKDKRKKYGIFYTSRRITQLILDRLPIEEIPPEKRFLLDPTCGSGSFLMAGERRLTELIRPRRLPDAEKAAQASAFIQGNDRDPFAVLVAQLQLVLDRPEAECKYKFKTVDIDFDLSTGISSGVPHKEQPSIIVGNPPFLRHGKVEEQAALFLHAAVAEWLSDAGLLGFVLPATFLSGADRCRTARETILDSCELLEVWDLPRNILSDEADGNGGTNGGDIESCVVLLRKRRPSRNRVSFCRLFGVERKTDARKSFRHSGRFTAHGLCVPSTYWTRLPQAMWAGTPLSAPLARLYAPGECLAVKDVCQVRNGIQSIPEKPVEAESPPSTDHVPWLQTAKGTRAVTLSVWKRGFKSNYIEYPGEMRWPRLEWARRDSNSGESLSDAVWRRRGIFAGQKILIHKNVDPATPSPLRAFVDIGHYPSDNFHFAWLDPALPEREGWTYESLLAVLNCPVSQICLGLARTRNKPTELIESIPIPKLDRKSVSAITDRVSAILRMHRDDVEARRVLIQALDRQILSFYPLSKWEQESFWRAVWGGTQHEGRHTWSERPWPVYGVVESIREPDKKGPAAIRIRIPAFRRDAQVYDGPIPPDMPGWAMVVGIEFQAEIPWSDAEQCRFDPLKVQRFRPLPFANETRQKRGRAQFERGIKT